MNKQTMYLPEAQYLLAQQVEELEPETLAKILEIALDQRVSYNPTSEKFTIHPAKEKDK